MSPSSGDLAPRIAQARLTGVSYPHVASCPAMGRAVVSSMGIGQVSGSLQGILGPAIKTRSRHMNLLVACPKADK